MRFMVHTMSISEFRKALANAPAPDLLATARRAIDASEEVDAAACGGTELLFTLAVAALVTGVGDLPGMKEWILEHGSAAGMLAVDVDGAEEEKARREAMLRAVDELWLRLGSEGLMLKILDTMQCVAELHRVEQKRLSPKKRPKKRKRISSGHWTTFTLPSRTFRRIWTLVQLTRCWMSGLKTRTAVLW